MKGKRRRLGGMLALSLLVAASGAWAQNAAIELSDLNYQDTSWSQGQLLNRGYRQQSNDGSGYEYWWNADKQQCVIVHSERNKVASVVTSSPVDCGQQPQQNNSGSSNSNAAAALVAAAAILGVAAIAHKSHHHDDDNHDGDSRNEADFERGYRDGLYNQSYDTHSNSSYQQGYQSGVRDHDSRTSYRGYSGGNPEVTCESKGNQRVECPMDTAGAVRVVRQLSHSPCTEGSSWGLSKHAVWVENGCRAVFQKN
jgi:hypothetical protein